MSEVIRPFKNVGQFTAFDNAILDHVMRLVGPNTWKVICATVRKTTGWHKKRDTISYQQYLDMTGIASRSTLKGALDDAIQMGMLIREKKGRGFIYYLNREYVLTSTESVPMNGTESVPITGTETVHTKETLNKEKKNVSRKRDERLDHPAIRVYRKVMRFHVPIAWRDRVIKRVGESSRWEAHLMEWVGRGYNPRNLEGITKSFQEGLGKQRSGKYDYSMEDIE